MSVKVFIDGSSGTTGLRIADRLAQRPEIELLSISAEGRKDVNERAKVINSADLAFLCLPDAASKEVMPLLRPDVKVLDTSTAFRTDAAWDYGFPELAGQKEKSKIPAAWQCPAAMPAALSALPARWWSWALHRQIIPSAAPASPATPAAAKDDRRVRER